MVPMSSESISKYISLILRHKPEVIGITLDEHGWANVEELIAGIAKKNQFDMEMLEEIVRTDEKQRYSFNEDKTLIRANQGHSIPVNVELEQVSPPEYYLLCISFAEYGFCSVTLNFLGKENDSKDDYLGLEIIFSYDMKNDSFSVREVNSEVI